MRKAIDPVNQWKKIRKYLLDHEVSTLMIARIEHKYVAAVKNRNFDKLQAFIDGNDSKLSSIITDFLSSLCAKLILGTIGGV